MGFRQVFMVRLQSDGHNHVMMPVGTPRGSGKCYALRPVGTHRGAGVAQFKVSVGTFLVPALFEHLWPAGTSAVLAKKQML